MSNTSQAFQHFHDAMELWERHGEPGYLRSAKDWAARALSLCRDDFKIPFWIELRRAGPMLAWCDRCRAGTAINTPHMLGTYLDYHYWCGLSTECWRCERCGGFEAMHFDTCRACEAGRRVDASMRVASPWRPELRKYELWRRWDGTLTYEGTLHLRSLREAMRATRAILQREPFRIVLLGTDLRWDESHVSK